MLRAFFIAVLLLFSTEPVRAAAPLHLVFDIDWTLVYPLPSKPPFPDALTVEVEGKWYRFADDAAEVVAEAASSPDYRLSFFSGGTMSRNRELLKRLMLPDGRSALDASVQVLGFDDLSPGDTRPGARFSERWKKDLTKIEPNLNNVVLFEDIPHFHTTEQKANLLWIGPTYDYAPSFEAGVLAGGEKKFTPPHHAAWRREKSKLQRSLAIVKRARAETAGRPELFLERMQTLRTGGDCGFLFTRLLSR
ncbi:MAG: hypothetical protein EOP11_06725 [Proteobacteria bacterium]|nr:MAG: hypothetical protein EOP11_06725 [Pseudomonadota bacterium]